MFQLGESVVHWGLLCFNVVNSLTGDSAIHFCCLRRPWCHDWVCNSMVRTGVGSTSVLA